MAGLEAVPTALFMERERLANRLTILLKVLGFALGGFASLMLAAAFYVWVSFDAHQVETGLAHYLAENYQRTLHIEGGVSLSLWPWPTLKLSNATLSEPKLDDIFLVIKQARLKLALAPLLSGRMVVSGIEARGGTLNLIEGRSGTWNFADLLHADDNSIKPADAFRLDGVDLSDVMLSVHDTASGRQWVLQNLRLTSDGLRTGAIGAIHAKAKLSAADLNTNGDFTLNSRYRFVSDTTGRLDDMTMNLHGRIGNLSSSDSSFKLNTLTWKEQGASWLLRQATFSLHGALGSRVLDMTAELPALAWTKNAPRADVLNAQLSVRGADQELQLQTDIHGIVPATGGFSAGRMQTKWQSHNGAMGTQGQLASPLRVDWHMGQLDWERLTGELSLSHPRLNPANARAMIDGTVSWHLGDGAKQDAKGIFKLTAQSGKDDLRLDAEVTHVFPLTAHFDLSSARFDTSRLLVAAPSTASTTNTLIPTFEDLALDGNISLDDLKINGLKIDALRLPIKVINDRFESASHNISLYGGTLHGSLALDAHSGELAWRENFDDVDLHTLARDTGAQLLVDGHATGTLDLSARGKDMAQLIKNATGIIRLKLAQASLQGVDIGQSMHEFRTAYQTGQLTARTPSSKEQTELAEAGGNIGVGGGKLFTRTLTAHNAWLRLAFNGEFDMQQNMLDLGVHAVASNPPPKAQFSDLVELRGKSMPLRIKGPLAQPDIQLELPATVAKSSAKSARLTPREAAVSVPANSAKIAKQTVAKSLSKPAGKSPTKTSVP
ncbi:MAG TPA: AsmA family protein [Rhodocyclaceae bacterium]|nr:AsmA family protein [Rhodocyclaceae bacterium]